jgi:V/A-type H+-transporting ATPase subunit A
VDTYTPIEKQHDLLSLILRFHKQGLAAIEHGVETADLFALQVREEIARAKYIDYAEADKIRGIADVIDKQIKELYSAVTS